MIESTGQWRNAGRQILAHRTIAITVGVVVALIAAVPLTSSSGSTADAKPPRAVHGPLNGFSHTEDGVQTAAGRYATALGGKAMFSPRARHRLVTALAAPARADALRRTLDPDYDGFSELVGLSADGQPPKGQVLISETMPADITVGAYSDASARVTVWCSGLFGLTDKPDDAVSSWFTMTMKLVWTGGDWKLSEIRRDDGPTPDVG